MSLVTLNEQYNIKYKDDTFEIYTVSYTHVTINEVHLRDNCGYNITHHSFSNIYMRL